MQGLKKAICSCYCVGKRLELQSMTLVFLSHHAVDECITTALEG